MQILFSKSTLFSWLNYLTISYLCVIYSDYSLSAFSCLSPVLAIFSSLRLPFHISVFFCHVLWLTGLNHEHLCDHGFGTNHWSPVGSSMGTQCKTMTVRPPEFINSQYFLREWEGTMSTPLICDWPLIDSVLCWPISGHCGCCGIMTAMFLSCPEGSILQPFCLFSSSYTLSASSSTHFLSLRECGISVLFRAENSITI